MPNLVKVGRTNNTPDQRFSELYTTGVPTPFVLELSLEVPNSIISERKAHSALTRYRKSANREFFEISARKAIKLVLGVVGDCKVREFRHDYGIENLLKEIHYLVSVHKRPVFKATRPAGAVKLFLLTHFIPATSQPVVFRRHFDRELAFFRHRKASARVPIRLFVNALEWLG
ncbi:MAG: GIY-YIG nuclease family protein, partial [Pseudomonadota bacterium]|nr:GIY-YIG nuclease family protein [Pseudomonadota bacterium]